MTNKEELRRLAQAAMPGPWRVGHPPPNGEQTIGTLDGLMVAVATTGWAVNAKLNADYVAAANPATVLELLDEIERLRAEIEAMRKQEPAYWRPIPAVPYAQENNDEHN